MQTLRSLKVVYGLDHHFVDTYNTLAFSNPLLLQNAFFLALLGERVVFGQFGLTNLEDTTLTLIRGYASACLGYGVAMLLLGKVAAVERGLLVSSLVFNGTETMLQLHAAVALDGYNSMVYATLCSHFTLTAWTLWNLLTVANKTSKD
jgi:hypothetical protein